MKMYKSLGRWRNEKKRKMSYETKIRQKESPENFGECFMSKRLLSFLANRPLSGSVVGVELLLSNKDVVSEATSFSSSGVVEGLLILLCMMDWMLLTAEKT